VICIRRQDVLSERTKNTWWLVRSPFATAILLDAFACFSTLIRWLLLVHGVVP